MQSTLRRRLLLLGVLLVVGALAGGVIATLDMQKTIQGSNEESISVVKVPDSAQSATQRAELQAKHTDLLMTLISIASNNSTVQHITTGKNASVVGIGIDKGGSQGVSTAGTALLVIKVDDTYYAIQEDVVHKQVTGVSKRVCYGPECTG